jgi:hypothetical protein
MAEVDIRTDIVPPQYLCMAGSTISADQNTIARQGRA